LTEGSHRSQTQNKTGSLHLGIAQTQLVITSYSEKAAHLFYSVLFLKGADIKCHSKVLNAINS